MAYPTSAITFTTKNAGDTIEASHVNAVQTEVAAMEAALLTGGLAHNLMPSADSTWYLGSSATKWIINASQLTGSLSTALGIDGGSIMPGTIPSTTLSTVGTPSSGTYLSGAGWQEVTPAPLAAYKSTLANAINSSNPFNILHFQVPANAMSDGDVIDVRLAVNLADNNTTNSIVWRAVWGNSTVVIGAANWLANATERKYVLHFQFMRASTAVWVRKEDGLAAADLETPFLDNLAIYDNVAACSTVDFTASCTVAIQAQLGLAGSSAYVKPVSALVHHRKVG